MVAVVALRIAFFLTCVICRRTYTLDKPCVSIDFLDIFRMSRSNFHPFFEQATVQEPRQSRRALKRSRQGPNSLGSTSIAGHFLNTGGATDVQVGVTAVGAPEGIPSGTPNFHGRSAHALSYRQQVRKRALQRACRRAQACPSGGTMYRGRWMTAQQLGVSPGRLEEFSGFTGASVQQRITRSTTCARVNVCSINIGGFDTATYDSFLNWLDSSSVDIVAVEEIHFGLGRESREFTTGRWHVVTSVSTRFSGVAFFIRAAKWSIEQIRFKEVVQGRVLHVRIQESRHALDLVAVYQHVRPNIGSHEDSKTMSTRAELWFSLHRLLASFPQRNPLIMMGDFNCNIKTSSGLAGNHVLAPQKRHADQSELQHIMQAFHLCALNTWTGSSSDQVTCRGHNFGVQIDFIFTRSVHADQVARSCVPLQYINFSPWRDGTRHHMLQASVPTFPGWRKPQHSARSRFDSRSLIASVREQDARCRELQQRFEAQVHSCPSTTPQHANRFLLQQCCRLYPPRQAVANKHAWQTFEVKHAVQELHRQRSMLAILPVRSLNERKRLAQIFRAFRESVRLHRMSKFLRQTGRKVRKERIHHLMQGLERASLQNDFYLLYRQIRRLAPKAQRKRVQVRDEAGHVLGPAAEHAAIVKHFQDLFEDPSHTPYILDGSCQLCLEIDSIAKGFAKLKLDTSVPFDCAPTAAWKAVSGVAIPWLHHCAEHALNQVHLIPSLWTDCHLCLIPKPNKKSMLPKDLRPLGIQEVTGKIVISAIRDQLRDLVHGIASQFPQFAYMQGRGTDAAIARVSTHCRLVREANRSERISLHAHAAGMTRKQMQGGGQLKLDLSTAFDLIPRRKLLESLHWSGASAGLVSSIMAWHDQCQYHIRHGGSETSFPMQKGVRQGCPLAPLLFSIFSAYLLQQLAESIGMERVLACITLFADDTHAKWIFQDPSSFKTLLGDVQQIFSLFKANGMIANSSKSEFICVSRNPHIQRMIAARLLKIDGIQHMDLGLPGNPIMVKFVHEFEYLGILASYKDFEFRSLLHRLSAAETNYGRLKRILHSSRYVSVKRRLIIHNACVRSSATYGLLAVGLTLPMLDRLSKFEIRHVRAIAKAPRHLNYESTADLLSRLKQNSPAEFLYKLAINRIQSVEGDLSIDLLESLKLSVDTLDRHFAGQGPQPAPEAQHIPCPICGVYFGSVSSMRLHHARKHKVALGLQRKDYAYLSRSLRMEDHMTNGLPTCRHCGKKYSRPQALKMHLLKTCPVFIPSDEQPVNVVVPQQPESEIQEQAGETLTATAALSQPVLHWPQVRGAWQGDWRSVLSDAPVKKRLKNHCIFCDAYFVSGGLKSHLRRSHATEYKFQASAEAVCRSSGKCTFSPCEGCGLVLKPGSLRTHPARCEVLFQLRLAFEVHCSHHGRPGCSDDRGSSGCRVASLFEVHEPTNASGREGITVRGGSCPQSSTVGRGEQREGESGFEAPATGGMEKLGLPSGRASRTGSSLHVFEHGPAPAAPRRFDQSTAARQQLCPLVEDGSASGASGKPACSLTTMETSKRKSSGDNLPSTGLVAQHVGRSDKEARPSQSEPRAKNQLRQSRLFDGDRRPAFVALSAVGSPGEKPEARSQPQIPHFAGSTRDSAKVVGEVIRSTGCHPVPSDTSFGSRTQGSFPYLHGVDSQQGRGCQLDTSGFNDNSRQRLHPGGGHIPQAGAAASVATGEHSQQAAPIFREQEGIRSALLKARFGNDSNYCYSNAILLASYWTWSFLQADCLLGRGLDRAILDLCGRRRTFHVWTLLPWRQLMRAWSSPGIQHDAAEFLQFLQATASPVIFRSLWHARSLVQDAVTIMDRGDGCPLLLPVPPSESASITLQSMLDDWQSQAMVHGFESAPMSVVLQIGRFIQVDAAWTKSTRRVLIPDTCSLPVFTDGLNLEHRRYKFRAGLIHLGDSPRTGHYRSILKAEVGPALFITDDGVYAARVTRAQEDMVQANLYLCFFTLVQ